MKLVVMLMTWTERWFPCIMCLLPTVNLEAKSAEFYRLLGPRIIDRPQMPGLAIRGPFPLVPLKALSQGTLQMPSTP